MAKLPPSGFKLVLLGQIGLDLKLVRLWKTLGMAKLPLVRLASHSAGATAYCSSKFELPFHLFCGTDLIKTPCAPW